jgi:hypothetical protein
MHWMRRTINPFRVILNTTEIYVSNTRSPLVPYLAEAFNFKKISYTHTYTYIYTCKEVFKGT